MLLAASFAICIVSKKDSIPEIIIAIIIVIRFVKVKLVIS